MLSITQKTKTVTAERVGQIDESILSSKEPVIIKGLINDWKLVERGVQSHSSAIEYLKSYYNGRPSVICIGEPSIQGRFFYDADDTQLNFQTQKMQVDEALDLIEASFCEQSPCSYYLASNLIDTHFPGFRTENDISIPRPAADFPLEDVRVSIWIGNRTTACCHHDAPDNLACCVVGKRRFTLFPPDQIANLYPGPLTPTPGGQPISMVDFNDPDFTKYPRFAEAIKNGQVAELEAGDALYLPSMWWHQVESQSKFNVLVNYWWSNSERHMGPAKDVLYHAMLSLRGRPEHEKLAWKHVFDYYIFGEEERATEHLSEQARGYLGKIDKEKGRMLRAMLLNLLNR